MPDAPTELITPIQAEIRRLRERAAELQQEIEKARREAAEKLENAQQETWEAK